MSDKVVLMNIESDIATVMINRPQVMNALNKEVLNELTQCFADISKNQNIKGVIVSGVGDKAFVAGADIAAMKEMTALEASHFAMLGHRTMRFVEQCHAPVIAAVNGFALGGGLELALSCDFIYISTKAKLGLPEVNLGILPGFGGTQRLSRLIGKNKAKEMIFTGRMITADEALKLGIANKLCEPDQLMDEVVKTLIEIRKKGPLAISLAKRVINDGTDLSLEAGLTLEECSFPMIFATEDKREGVSAFLEKREAKFIGR